MTRSTLIVLMLAGCGRFNGPEADHGNSDEPPDAHDEAGGEHADANILEVSADLKRDLRVSTAAATARAGDERVALLGELRVHEDGLAEVAAPVGARIGRVLVRSGDSVRAGQPLAELESAALGHARAALLSARAGAVQVDAALARKRGLQEVVSKAELEIAEAEATGAAASVRAAEAELAAWGVGASLPDPVDGRFLLRAPTGGVVLARNATRGAVVDAEEVLFRIGDLDRLQVEVHAFERDAVRLSGGDHADIELSALPGETFPGTVSRVGGEVEVESRTLPIRIDVRNDGRLRPGMAATARLDIADTGDGVVATPGAALQRLSGGWVVFVPAGEDRFEVRPVGRGRDLGGDVEILSGLTAGEVVVVDGAFLLKAEAEKRAGGGEEHEH